MSDLNEQAINKCNILYMEGYLWDRLPSKEAFMYASNVNKLSGGKNALSLSDVFCVEAHRDSFLDLIKDNIDIVFCNEDELNTLTKQNSVEESVKFVNKYFPNLDQLICTLGPKGALVIKNKTEYFYEATETEVVDKTGAGDYFAAGYLYGIENDFSIEDAALIANKSAAYVISEIGVRPEKPFSL